MKVAFVGGRGVGSKYSGIETFYEAIAPRLKDHGIDVRIYCRSYFTPADGKLGEVELVRLPTLMLKHFETPFHSFISSLHALLTGCDVIHYHAIGSALLIPLAKLGRRKTVVTIQGLDWKRAKWGRMARAVLRTSEWCAVRLPDRSIVVSEVLRSYLEGVHGGDVLYIPNGVDEPRPVSSEPLRRLALRPGSYVLFMGRLSPEKKCEQLIDAFNQLPTDFELVLAGSGRDHDYVQMLRARANGRVRFPGYVAGETQAALVQHAGLFVLPSSIEGLSLALLEAMAAGVPALVSDIPENVEAVGPCGATFRVGDVGHLRDVMQELLGSEERRRRMGECGRERARREYSWERVAAEMAAVYRTLL